MIKEKKKKKKRRERTFIQEIVVYIKTAGVSFLVAAVISSYLSYLARIEMISNLYNSKQKRNLIEKKIAQQIVENSDLISTLTDKNYAVAMRVGELYEAAGDLQKAEYAYYIATQKAPNGKYISYLRLTLILIAQNKINEAEKTIASVVDNNTLSLIRYKTRAFIVLGDKFYSENKYLKAAEAYEQANYYYKRLAKVDKQVNESIQKRLVQAYIDTATVLIKNGYNSDAARFLKKALKYDPDNLTIQYRLAIVYADLDPIISVEYFEPLIAKIPQDIDRDIFANVLMKAANIMDIQGNSIKAKYYRYKIHSLDIYTHNKVIYKEDIEIALNSFIIKKSLFTYKLKSEFTIRNISAQDIKKMSADFVLRQGDKERERVTIKNCATNRHPLYSNGGELNNIAVQFGNNIFTKRELQQYYIDIYLYKDADYKTFIGSLKVPLKNIYQKSSTLTSPHL